ncbi:LL-diaminopimelate aminotransferase [Thermaerobacillus caldiproteolyticus]|uniref:LL-diaminopimelate aminotransferase n=1 Tax=Thermaerobacillus caldiproteolyticus TaxID=247480 RepID=UPI00188C8BE9|nr:LL-diaminopimelate aminotransferase [Anoxybacillus caldiproteolyticus]QPA32463.1 LL-diaminopimelate aminotransferase [Anoxybacillus caldiproteolyticus]
MRKAERMKEFGTSVFSQLAAYKQSKISQGYDMIDLSIGSPDLPPPSFIRKTLAFYANNPDTYGYTLEGTHEFHEAVASYYEMNHHVSLNPNKEIACLMGSQDGLVHLPMAFANPGDVILVPDPGYTAYATGIAMAQAVPFFMPLRKENSFLPDLQAIPEEIAKRAALMFLNFPGNPVPALATESFFEEVIEFAKRYEIIVVSDFAYSELYYDGQKPISFLSIPGAKEVGVEMNSLSKSYNMAGCRIGYVCGNEQVIEVLTHFKSNLDYGVFLPIQKAAVAALTKGASFCEENRRIYQSRRDRFIDGLISMGWHVERPKASMFIWAEIPKGWTSVEFAYALMDRAHVVVTPGQAFGPNGEGFVRIALVQEEERLMQAVENMKKSGIFTG